MPTVPSPLESPTPLVYPPTLLPTATQTASATPVLPVEGTMEVTEEQFIPLESLPLEDNLDGFWVGDWEVAYQDNFDVPLAPGWSHGDRLWTYTTTRSALRFDGPPVWTSPSVAQSDDFRAEMQVELNGGDFRVRWHDTSSGEYELVTTADGALTLFRSAVAVANTELTLSGSSFVLGVEILDGAISVMVDGSSVLTFSDADPLPAGPMSISGSLAAVDSFVLWFPGSSGPLPEPLSAAPLVDNDCVIGTVPADASSLIVTSVSRAPGAGSPYDLYVMRGDGTGRQLLLSCTLSLYGARLSPDGTQIAFSASESMTSSEVYIMKIDGTTYEGGARIKRIIFLEPSGSSGGPVWSPDGSRIAFLYAPPIGDTSPAPGIYVLETANPAQVAPLGLISPNGMLGDTLPGDMDWSPDGTRILYPKRYETVTYGGANDWYTIAYPSGAVSPLITFSFPGYHWYVPQARWSPDGSKIAYYYWRIPTSPWEFGIAFYDIASQSRGIWRPNVNSWELDWSPDGQHIVYTVDGDGYSGSNLYIGAVGAGGSDIQVTFSETDSGPDWGNAPVTPTPTYTPTPGPTPTLPFCPPGTGAASPICLEVIYGLTGSYFNNDTFTNPPVLTRIDHPNPFSFSWSGAPDDPSVIADGFSVRWAGYIRAPFDDRYTFYVTADDRVRLTVNGSLMINAWGNPSEPQEYTAANVVWLEQGEFYPILLEYSDQSGATQLSLSWSGAERLAKQPVYEFDLFPVLPIFTVESMISELTSYGVAVYPAGVPAGQANGRAWTLDELLQLRIAVMEIASAFNRLKYGSSDGTSSQARQLFARVMRHQGTSTPLSVLRVENGYMLPIPDGGCDGAENEGCTSNGNNAVILYGTFYFGPATTGTAPVDVTRAHYTIVHEFGHRFDNQSAVGQSSCPSTSIEGLYCRMDRSGIVIKDCSAVNSDGSPDRERVLGIAPLEIPNDWKRGVRGWGDVVGNDVRGHSDFQQNLYVVTPPSSVEDRMQEIREALADMFLNWVFRRNTDNPPTGGACNGPDAGTWQGFRNLNENGDLEPLRTGNARFWWMEQQLASIFSQHGGW